MKQKNYEIECLSKFLNNQPIKKFNNGGDLTPWERAQELNYENGFAHVADEDLQFAGILPEMTIYSKPNTIKQQIMITKGAPESEGFMDPKSNEVVYPAIDYRYGTPTQHCAAYANGLVSLDDRYAPESGHAWTRSHDNEFVINGFKNLYKDLIYNREKANKRNSEAADYVAQHFSIDQLDPNEVYFAHLSYPESPSLFKAYYGAEDGITSTHTGNLMYDKASGQWVVLHNVSGKVYKHNLYDLLGSRHKKHYAVTAISKANKKK